MSVTPDFLEPRPDLADRSPAAHLDDAFDDMRDSSREVTAYSGLPLAACSEIANQFDEFDRLALRYQRRHKLSTRIAASTGTLAVIMAILGLALKDQIKESVLANVISRSEISFALVALAVALFGLGLALKERWLLTRHQAELCRLLKFRFLLQPSRWSAGQEQQAWVQHALLQIREMGVKKSVREAIEAPLPRFTLPEADAVMPHDDLRRLLDYYRCKRLALQRAYLENRAGQNDAKIRLYVTLPPILFFLSVFGAATHYLLEHLSSNPADAGRREKWVLLAGLAAACLPVAATWARTIRAAFEHSRNKSRFRAASATLLDLDRCLVQDADAVREPVDRPGRRETVDARLPLQDMLWCEQILHMEHVEWLRLMVETEWYG